MPTSTRDILSDIGAAVGALLLLGAAGHASADPRPPGLPADAVEVAARRTLTAKHFQRSDGSFVGVFAAGPLHYHAPDGSLQDVDLDFHACGNDQVVDRTDAARVRIPGGAVGSSPSFARVSFVRIAGLSSEGTVRS